MLMKQNARDEPFPSSAIDKKNPQTHARLG